MAGFGWSYPPGCSGPPDDQEGPCDVCHGNPETSCICPECPECGTVGDPDCYKNHGLELKPEQIEQAARFEAQWRDTAEADALAEMHLDQNPWEETE